MDSLQGVTSRWFIDAKNAAQLGVLLKGVLINVLMVIGAKSVDTMRERWLIKHFLNGLYQCT